MKLIAKVGNLGPVEIDREVISDDGKTVVLSTPTPQIVTNRTPIFYPNEEVKLLHEHGSVRGTVVSSNGETTIVRG